MPAAFDFVEDTEAKSFDFQADPIPTPKPAPSISPTAQLAKARLAFAPLAGQAVANLPDQPLITLPEWPKGEGSLEEQITGQVYGKLKDFLGFMTSPKGVAVTGAAIAAPEVAGPIISAAMLPAAVEEGIGTVKSIGKGDIPSAAGHLTGLTLTGAGVLGGVAQFLPRTVAEARVPVETLRAPEPIAIPEPVYSGPTPPKIAAVEQAARRAAVKAARPVVPETPPEPQRGMTILDEIRAAGADTKAKIQKLFPQLSRETAAKLRDQAFPREKQPDNISRAEVDRLFLDKLNEESNREIEAATTPKPAPEIPEVRKIALEQQKAAGWNPDWPFVPADLMNKSFRDAIRSDPTIAAEEKAKILSFGPKDEQTPAPLTPAEQSEARADPAAEMGEEPQAPAAPEPAPASETPPAISAPEAKAPEPTQPAKVEAPAAKEPYVSGVSAQDKGISQAEKEFRSTAEGQKAMANRASRIAVLNQLNEAIRKVDPKEAYDRALIEQTPDSQVDSMLESLRQDYNRLVAKPAAKPAAETGTPAPEVAYDASLEAFRKASREFTKAQNAYRARTIGDEEFLAASKKFKEAEAIADKAERDFIDAKNATGAAITAKEARESEIKRTAPVAAAAKVEQQVKTVAKAEGQRSAKEVKSELVQRIESELSKTPEYSREVTFGKTATYSGKKKIEVRPTEGPWNNSLTIEEDPQLHTWNLVVADYVGGTKYPKQLRQIISSNLSLQEAKAQAIEQINAGNPWHLDKAILDQGKEFTPNVEKMTAQGHTFREKPETVTIDIPGDGSFTIPKTRYALERILTRAKSVETSAKPGKGYSESKPTQAEGKQWLKEAQVKPPETPPTGPGVPTQPTTPEARLSQSLQSVPKQKPPPQGPASQPMGITPFPGLVTGLQKVAQSAQRVWREIADVPKFAPFKRVINKFNGDTQRTSLKIRQMQADIESRVPDPKRLEAITNWLQADGDVAKLRAWEAASRNATRRQGYRDAQHLTPYEVQVAQAIRQYYDDLLARGQAYGILDQAKDDYVTQIWRRPLLGGAQFAQFASKLSRTFKFGMKSVFENFFEGEQAGYKPVTKNISKLLGVYVSELEKTIATRDMIRDLTHETASDGNPLAKVEGTAHIAQDQAGDPTGPMFVRPGVVKGDVRYAELNHPALKNWKWISKDPESGRDVFILGELRVHPEIRRHLSNVLSQSQIRKWMREPSESELANIVKLAARFGDTTSKVVKQTMLGTLSTFHHVQEGTHGLGHRANAFLPPKLPVGTPELNYALDHGLQLAGEGAALENFREGLGSHGVFDKVPVLGKWIEKHNDLLFNEYIPRLKWDTWQRINRRNMARYQKEIASGEVTADDVAYLSSKQTNAAFGHQNYTDLGRNATVQHVLRLFALAPDFLEARTRFAGQAAQGLLSKVGREQLEALSLLGGLFYIGARIGNKLSDDDYHWEEPFRVKYGNRWYGMRSVPEDLWRAFNDTQVFAYNRLNPVFGRPTMELLSGVNYRGEKIPASEVFKNILVSGIPIQMREFPGFRSLTETQRNTTIGAWEQFLSSVGVQVSRYSPLNQTYKLATKWRKAQGEKEAPTTYPVSKYQPLRYALEDHDLTRAADELAKLTEGGKVPLAKIAQGFRISLHRPFSGSLANEGKFVASLTPDQKALYREAIAQRSRVWREFTNAEKEYHNRLKEGR